MYHPYNTSKAPRTWTPRDYTYGIRVLKRGRSKLRTRYAPYSVYMYMHTALEMHNPYTRENQYTKRDVPRIRVISCAHLRDSIVLVSD